MYISMALAKWRLLSLRARFFFFFRQFISLHMRNVFEQVGKCLLITSAYHWRIPSHPRPDRCCGSHGCSAPPVPWRLASSPLTDKYSALSRSHTQSHTPHLCLIIHAATARGLDWGSGGRTRQGRDEEEAECN